jgi:sterol carrier protein 2
MSMIAGQAMTTDRASTFDSGDMMCVVGYDMSREAAQKVYAKAGIGPEDLTWSNCTTASPTTS